jgi:hypothetical protein
MVDLNDKRDFVRVLSAHDAQHAICGCHAIAAAFDRQLDDVFRIEIDRVGGEGGSAAVFDALVYREDRAVAASSEPAVIQQPLEILQYIIATVTIDPHGINMVRGRQCKGGFVDCFTRMTKEVFRFIAQYIQDFLIRHGVSRFGSGKYKA